MRSSAPVFSATCRELTGPAPAIALYRPSFSPITNGGALMIAPMSVTALPMNSSSLASSMLVVLIEPSLARLSSHLALRSCALADSCARRAGRQVAATAKLLATRRHVCELLHG